MKSVLLISVQGIGNTVLMTPVIEALTGVGYEVDAVVSDNGSHEILQLCRDVRKQYLWRERDGAVRNFLRLRTEFRRDQYDAAYALYPNGKRENALLCLARADHKSRFTQPQARYRLLDFLPATEKIPLNPAHDVTNNLRLIQTAEAVPNSPLPVLSLSEERQDFAREFFSSNRLADKFVVAVHPGGGGLAKRWSERQYRELCGRLTADESIKLLVFGSASEEPVVRNIVQAIGDRALPVCGLSIDKVAGLISRSQLLVANDSALAHIASALGVAVVVIWGYTDFRRAAPVNPKALLIRIDYPCNPCYDFAKGYIEDCQYHLKCIKNISVDQVYRIVTRYISAIRSEQSLHPKIFASEPCVSSIQRVDSGCLKMDLNAA